MGPRAAARGCDPGGGEAGDTPFVQPALAEPSRRATANGRGGRRATKHTAKTDQGGRGASRAETDEGGRGLSLQATAALGLMVNYLYEPRAIEDNHEKFIRGEIVASQSVRGLVISD